MSLDLKPIFNLLPSEKVPYYNFYIPAYQRGYRWTKTEVNDLLTDIYEFVFPDNQLLQEEQNTSYCLQPIVVKPDREGRMELVDGQQRLTTLYLILKYLNSLRVEKKRTSLYEISYETRPSFEDFIEAGSEEDAIEDIDFYHLFEAKKTIEAFFDANEQFEDRLRDAILNQVHIIWYELDPSQDPIAAFTRLNVGKIPLTAAELIRALFLRRQNQAALNDASAPTSTEESQQFQIALEWDQVEKALQDDKFWYFLTNKTGTAHNRIELLFELATTEEMVPHIDQKDPKRVFYAFHEKLRDRNFAERRQHWEEIKRLYRRLEEWFDDRRLFHLIGFLISDGEEVQKLLHLSESLPKDQFEDALIDCIFTRLLNQDRQNLNGHERGTAIAEKLEETTYENGNATLKSLLLLFNVASLLQHDDSNILFHFELYKRQKWDIEHIRAVADAPPERIELQKLWLDNARPSVALRENCEQLLADLDKFLASSSRQGEDQSFNSLYGNILKEFEQTEGTETENGLSNLTLLDSYNNQSYKNAMFTVKRKQLLDCDRDGIFVPLCTRNVFLKCYSPSPGDMHHWSQQDGKSYIDAIRTTFNSLFEAESDPQKTTPST